MALRCRSVNTGWTSPVPGRVPPPGQRAPAVDRVRALPADRRSVLRRGDGVLGELRHGADGPAGDGLRSSQRDPAGQRAARLRVGAAKPRGRGCLLPRFVSRERRTGTEGESNNLKWLDDYAHAQNPVTNPFQILWINKRPDGGRHISLWEQTYLAHAIERANRHGSRRAGASGRDRQVPSQVVHERARLILEPRRARKLIAVSDQARPPGRVRRCVLHHDRGYLGSYRRGRSARSPALGPEARMNLIYGVRTAGRARRRPTTICFRSSGRLSRVA